MHPVRRRNRNQLHLPGPPDPSRKNL